MRIKDMIARCMERMRAGACATCDNRRVCPAGRWQSAIDPVRQWSDTGRSSGIFGTLLDSAIRALADTMDPAPCFARQVEEAIVLLLATGEASSDRVSETLGVSRQTLYRRLLAEGTSFEELLTAKRRQLAIRYLGVERVPVKVAAWRLGFSSSEAFSRAFKRWTGVSPGQFRSARG